MKDSDWEILYELYKNPNMTKVANLLYMTQPSLTEKTAAYGNRVPDFDREPDTEGT